MTSFSACVPINPDTETLIQILFSRETPLSVPLLNQTVLRPLCTPYIVVEQKSDRICWTTQTQGHPVHLSFQKAPKDLLFGKTEEKPKWSHGQETQ